MEGLDTSLKTRNSRKASMVCVKVDIRSMLMKTQKATNTLNREEKALEVECLSTC